MTASHSVSINSDYRLGRPFGDVAFSVSDGLLRLADAVTPAQGDAPLHIDARQVVLPELDPGSDYGIFYRDGVLSAEPATDSSLCDPAILGGFHFAPGGNAGARHGGDSTPAINPYSIWDTGFRPDCPDPRGMAFIAEAPRPFWCDIYLLCTTPWVGGTSQHGAMIADGDDLPGKRDGGVYDVLDHPTAIEIYAAFGKRLLGPEEFFAAAYGVTEGTAFGTDPVRTGLDAPRTSRYGIMQATGNMSIWGGDGDPAGHRLAARFGGSWDDGEFAGSRCARVGSWPGYSSVWIGARGRSDHLRPGA